MIALFAKLRRRLKKKRLKKIGLWALMVVLLGPIILVLPLNLIDPPATTLMLGRSLDRLIQGKVPAYPHRVVVPLEHISNDLVRAVLAAEDDAFYLHNGFDLRQIERAISERKSKKR